MPTPPPVGNPPNVDQAWNTVRYGFDVQMPHSLRRTVASLKHVRQMRRKA